MSKLVLPPSLSPTPSMATPVWGVKEALTVLGDGARPPADRVRAARQLAALHAQDAVIQMIGLLDRVSEDPELSAAVRDAVRRLGGLEQLMAQLADPSEAARRSAVAGLSRIGGDDARAAMRRIAACDPSPSVRRSALTPLATLPSAEDVATAVGALSDVDDEVRQSAAMVLGASGASAALAPLLTARAAETDAFVIYFYDRAIKRLQRLGN